MKKKILVTTLVASLCLVNVGSVFASATSVQSSVSSNYSSFEIVTDPNALLDLAYTTYIANTTRSATSNDEITVTQLVGETLHLDGTISHDYAITGLLY